MAMDSADTFGYVTGVITITILLYKVILSQLPSSKVRQLLELVQETDSLLINSKTQGLISPRFASNFEKDLEKCKRHTEWLHAEVCCLQNTLQEFLAIKGLSRSIRIACREVTRLRIDIATLSEKERARRIQGSQRDVNTLNAPTHVVSGSIDPLPTNAPTHWRKFWSRLFSAPQTSLDEESAPAALYRSPSAATLVEPDGFTPAILLAPPPRCALATNESTAHRQRTS